MATVSQIAATQGGRGLIQVPVGRHCAVPPRISKSGETFADRSPHAADDDDDDGGDDDDDGGGDDEDDDGDVCDCDDGNDGDDGDDR